MTKFMNGAMTTTALTAGYKNQDFPVDRLFAVYTNYGVIFTDIFDASNIDALDSSFLFYLMYDRKQTIRIQDIDHIMPKSILEANKVDWAKINSIKNYQLLDYGTNRGEKNGKPFKQWIYNFVSDKSAFVKKHLIPADENNWTEDKFELFINERSKLILGKITSYVY